MNGAVSNTLWFITQDSYSSSFDYLRERYFPHKQEVEEEPRGEYRQSCVWIRHLEVISPQVQLFRERCYFPEKVKEKISWRVPSTVWWDLSRFAKMTPVSCGRK